MASIARVFGEPEDDWVRIADRAAKSDLPMLSLPVRPRMDRLPLGELTPSEFERFTSHLLAALYPNTPVNRVGGQGHAQQGADILVRTSDGIHLFQCKRVQRFGPVQMKAVAAAAAETIADKRVLVLSRVATPAARSTAEYVGWDIWDHDNVVRMLQHEVSPEQARRVLEVFFPMWKEDFLGIRGGGPWALPDEFFAGQREDSPFSHSYELVGREDEVAKVLDWVRGDRSFFLLTGAAGVGKSRFLMEAVRRIDAGADRPVVYFVDKNASVDLEHFQRLGDDRSIIVVDDAHDRDDLGVIIRGARAQSEQPRRVRVLFATREYGRPRLVRALAEHAHELDPPTAHLAPLASADAHQLAAHVLGAPENSPPTRRLVAVAGDCTLFLVAAGYLLKTKYVDPTFLDDEEDFRVAVLERMYKEYVSGADHLSDDVSVADVLRFLAAVHPFDLAYEDSLEAASRVLGCCRDVLTSALEEIVKTGVVVKRGSRLRLQPDLLADHILVGACFSRALGKATGYVDRIWRDSSAELRRNLIVNVARIDWRLSKTGMSPESMLSAAWGVLERDFKTGGIWQRLNLLDLLEKIAFYQPERTLNLVTWALEHELPPEHAEFGPYMHTSQDVRVRVAPVLQACAYHREWLGRACELLWRLAQSDQLQTNPHPDHPVRILCDLAAYSLYKPFDYTPRVISQALEWMRRDRAKLVFDILDQALRKEFVDHVSDGHSVTYYPCSALVLGERRVLALRDKVLDAVIQQFRGSDASLAVRAAKSIGFAMSHSMGRFGRKLDAKEVTVWDEESVRLLKRIRAELDGTRLSSPVSVALREVVEPEMGRKNEAIAAAAEEVLGTIADDLDHQVVEVLIHGPWRWHRHWTNREPSSDEVQRWLKDLARRFLEDSGETSMAVERVEQHLAEIKASSDAANADNFVAALVVEQLCVGIEIVRRVIADTDSPLALVTGVTLSAIRVIAAERALELTQALVNTGQTAARMSVAYAYGWGLASAPTVSSAELAVIRGLADDDLKVVHQLSHGLRFLAEGDPRMALMIILEMRIGRSEQLASEVLRLFSNTGPLRIDKLSNDELDRIVEELVVCNQIDDYWIHAFLASVSRNDLQRVVRLLQRRVEHAESLDESAVYRPFPFDWHDKWRLESPGTQDRRRILEELRDWAAKDAPGGIRCYEAPRLFAAVANGFDDEVLSVIELGLMAPAAIAVNVADLLSEVPRCFVWSHVQWIVRTLEDAERRDTEVYRAIGSALHTALMSGMRKGSPGEPFPEDVEQRDEARKVADSLPVGSPAERFYRSLQRVAERKIERRSESWV